MAPRPLLSRIGSIVAAGVLLAGAVGAPASAAGPAAPAGERIPTKALDRGRVVASEAAATPLRRDRTAKPHTAAIRVKAADVAESDFAGAAAPSPLLSLALDPKVAIDFPGMSRSGDNLLLEPPDPWVAVSPSYVMSSTNGLVRIANRSGITLASVPTHALFALGDGENDSDPRFLWDAAKGRWVGVLLSFGSAFPLDFGYLNLAVSETADPTGSWRIFSWEYTDSGGAPTLPDYPGLASSGDKVVLTAHEFAANFATYLGSSILVLRWSDLLSGTSPTPALSTAPDSSTPYIRPAINQSATNDIHLIGVDDASGLYEYAKLSGTTPALPSWTLISSMSAPFCGAVPPQQPDAPATITDAVDGRPTDAVYQAGVIAFVSTCAPTTVNYARLSLVTASTATAISDEIVGSGTVHAYMPGVSFADNGSVFLTWTQSSTTPGDYPSAFANVKSGGTWYAPVLLRQGSSAYLGTRWGDYVGVAMDPSATGAAWMNVEATDRYGDWETRVVRVVSDATQPAVTKAPTQALVNGTQLGLYTIPIRLSFAAADAQSGVKTITLGLNRSGTGFVDAGSATGTTATRNAWWKLSGDPDDLSHQWAAQAVDWAGNPSPAVAGSKLTPVVYDQSKSQFTFGSGWKTTTTSKALLGTAKYSSTTGASVSFKTSGRSFGFLTTRGSTRGKVKVYVDGTYKGTVTLTSSTTSYRRLAYVITFGSSATHTVRLVVKSGRVDVDGFVVLK